MGNLIMPKHSGEVSLIKSILNFYFSNQDWIKNTELKDYCKNTLKLDKKDESSYTRLAQWPAYFRFIEWQDPSTKSSPKRITDSGKRFLEALEGNDTEQMNFLLLESMENFTFGRNAHGVSSDSDYEAPNIAVRCALALDYFTKIEYQFILDQLVTNGRPIFDLISIVKKQRLTKDTIYPPITNTYVNDPKILQVLNECKFFIVDKKEYKLNESLLEKYADRLLALKITNSEVSQPSSSDEDEDETVISSQNKIYFGAPGTGKSYQITQDLKNVGLHFQKRVTFHPEYDNASFVGGYKPITDSKGDIKYEFVPQIFTDIYVEACNDPNKNYYLIIEEINRGNCAEIFGELFQLLDRDNKYKITPSNELIEYLNKKIPSSKFYNEGKMLLPDNLSILATMNTSDQSLFPMDSAFKRRWDWEYIPINYSKDVLDNDSANYTIVVNSTTKINWIDFIEKINPIIESNRNLGMDKCIGNYFVKPNQNNEISLEAFIHKVIFYLWNDVFKDEPRDSIFKDKISYQSFFPVETKGLKLVTSILQDLTLLKTTKTEEESIKSE